MPKRALIAIATFGLVATACVSSSTPAVDFGTGQRFVPFVVDSIDNMGRGDAVAMTADGTPYVSYFGFPAKLAKGEIAIPRPFGSPTVPGVMLATSSTDGLWQRGAVEMAAPPTALDPTNVAVPFGPVKTEKLDDDLKPDNTNGTAIALDQAATLNMAWTAGNTVSYATTKLGGTSTVEKVFEVPGSLDRAGPIGRPSIAVDPDGNVWIAFGVQTPSGIEIHVASQQGSKWADQTVASLPSCKGCPAPQPTGIGVVGGVPTAVFADPAARQVKAATMSAKGWTESTVASDVSGFGLSFASGADGAWAAYYTGAGSVEEATWKDGTWSTSKVSDAVDPDEQATGSDAANTAVASDGDTVAVAWEDEGLHLATSSGDSFTAEDLGTSASNGADPAVAVSGSGTALAWYDTLGQNQMVGYLGDLADVVVARPSPSLTVSQQPTAPTQECGKDKKVALDLTAQGIAFLETCLVAAPGDFTIDFTNKDVGTNHNVDVLDKQGGKSLGATTVTAGPDEQTLDLSLDAGQYFYQCDVHANMTGELVVVQGAK
jgi:plastocyanin